ncbi:unnamed protein product, partial [marine sediment metagenome]
MAGDTPTTPTISFCGAADTCNTGFYELSEDTVVFGRNGDDRWIWNASGYGNTGTGRPFLRDTAATDLVPNIIPRSDDPDTGVGSSAVDALSLIAGSLEGIRITETTGDLTINYTATQHVFKATEHVTSGDMFGIVADTTESLSSGVAEQSVLNIHGNIAQQLTAGYNGIKLVAHEVILGSGAAGTGGQNNLLAMGTDSNEAMFLVSNTGVLTLNDYT